MMLLTRKAVLAPTILALAATLVQTPSFAGHPNNYIERHPTQTGIVAAIATHHALKVAARNRKMHGRKLNWAERHPTLSAIGAGALTHHEIKAHTPQ